MDRATVAADRLFAAAFGILVTYGAARVLALEQFGLFVVFEAVRVGVLTCFDRTIGQALVFRVAAHPESSDATTSAALTLKLCVVVVLGALAALAWSVGPALLDVRWQSLAAALPAWVLLSMVQTTVQQGLQARRAYRALALTDAAALLLFAAVPWAWPGAIATPAAVMWVACGCRALAALCFARELVIRERPRRRALGDVVRFARAAFVNNAATYVSLRADGLLLALFATLTAAAQWGLVAPLINAYMLVGEAASLELFPDVSAAAAAGRHEQVRRAVAQSITVWCGTAAVLSCAAVLAPIDSLFAGEAQAHGSTSLLFALVAVAGPVLVLARIFAAVLNGYGLPVRNAHATLAALAVKGTVGAALIYAFAAAGAAVTLIATSFVILLVTGTAAVSCWREPRALAAVRTA